MHNMSISEFTKMVNSSIIPSNTVTNAVNEEVVKNDSAKCMTASSSEQNDMLSLLDDSDELLMADNGPAKVSILDNLDSLDDLDDLGSLGDLQRSNEISIEKNTAENDAISSQLPDFLRFKSLGDSDSKIPDWGGNVTIAAKTASDEDNTSLFSAIHKKIEQSFMVTQGCSTYAELWNKNFVAMKLDSDSRALECFLAMFYHVACQSDSVVNILKQADDVVLVRRLAELGHIITMADLSDDNPGEAEEDLMLQDSIVSDDIKDDETPAVPKSVEIQQDNVQETETVTISTNDTYALTSKAKRQRFINLMFRHLFTERNRDRMESKTSAASSYAELCKVFVNGGLEPEEFVKFALFLAKTREIILDIAMVSEYKTFNHYFAAMICKMCKHSAADTDVNVDEKIHDSLIVIGMSVEGITEVFYDYVAFGWRMLRSAIRKSSCVEVITINDKKLYVLKLNRDIPTPKINFHEAPSSLTMLARDFTETATKSVFVTSQLKEITSDDLDFYVLKHNGLGVPNSFRYFSRQQKALLETVLSYSAVYQPDIFKLVASGKVARINLIKPCLLSSDRTLALYRIVLTLLAQEGTIQLNDGSVSVQEPKFVLSGSGIPKNGIHMTLHSFFDSFTAIALHVKLSSVTNTSINNDGSLVFNFVQ